MMDKTEMRYLAEDMVEDLRELEDGTSITTYQLLTRYGYTEKDLDIGELFDLHNMLFKLAKANHITLDMSAHEGLAEGLPFHLDFVVRNKKAQYKCPHCGSVNTARYLYGMPAFSEEMQVKLDAGKWVLGGCCISSVEINGQSVDTMSARRCNDCKKDFASAPILINRKAETFEDYRDIVTAVKFSVGGYFGGYTEITIRKNDKGAIVKAQNTLDYEDLPGSKQITPAKWQKIINTLYGQLYLHEWKKNYVDPEVLDGTQWSLDISLTNNRKRSYYGCNDYPPYWNELLKVFREFAKI